MGHPPVTAYLKTARVKETIEVVRNENPHSRSLRALEWGTLVDIFNAKDGYLGHLPTGMPEGRKPGRRGRRKS